MAILNGKRWLGWLSAAVALVLAGVASADVPQRPSSFPSEFSAGVREKLLVEIPLVRNGEARLLLSRTLSGLGGAERDQAAEEILGRYAFRSATPEEMAAGRATHVGLATLYADRENSVRGDGRTVLLGELLVRDADGRIAAIDDVQIQGGVKTGLRPREAADGDHFHADYAKRLPEGFRDYLNSSFLTQNEIPHAVIEHLFDAGRTTTTRDREGGTWTEPTGTFVRRGNFFNLGHLVQLERDPPALREVLDHVNRQLSLRLGRVRPLSWGGLFDQLARAEASKWAALYFARVQYGSTTIDNTSPLSPKDLGTLAVLDRTHEGFRLTEPTEGYGREGPFALREFIMRELRSLMSIAATPEERRQLPPTLGGAFQLVTKLYREELAVHLLEHVGFASEDVRAALAHGRKAILGEGRLLDTVLKLARETAPGRSRDLDWLGLRDPRDETPAVENVRSNPARFDLFNALAELAVVHGSSESQDDKLRHLAAALRPLNGDSERALEAARELLASAGPVFENALRHLEGVARGRKLPPAVVRAAKVALFAAKAQEINRPVETMFWPSLVAESYGLKDLAVARLDVATRVAAFERTMAFRGPRTGHGTAERLRRDAPARTFDGKLILSEDVENGVRLQEVSDGVADALRVVLEGDPLGAGAGGHRLWWDAGDGRAGEIASPMHVDGPRATFELPFPVGLRSLRAGFLGPEGQSWPGGDGISVLRNHVFVLASPLVQAQLARFAKDDGRIRAGVSDATVAAASSRPVWKPRQTSSQTPSRLGAASVPELREKLLRNAPSRAR